MLNSGNKDIHTYIHTYIASNDKIIDLLRKQESLMDASTMVSTAGNNKIILGKQESLTDVLTMAM
jgi:hypothetical protein